MINISKLPDIGPVSITTDPKKFQQDLQELFVQVRFLIKNIHSNIYLELATRKF